MPREGGASSNLWLPGSTTPVSGILDRPPSRTMTPRMLKVCATKKKGRDCSRPFVVVRRALLRFRALRGLCRPRLDQGVVVDRLALRLLVGELALGSNRAVLLGLGEPVLGRLLLVQLRTAGALHAGLLQTFHDGVLSSGKRVHRGLRRLRTG